MKTKRQEIAVCKHCGKEFPAFNKYSHRRVYCSRDCQHRYTAAGERNPNWRGGTGKAKDPIKKRAQYAANRAIRKGVLVRQPCEQCGSTVRIQAHHDDYSKPLEVRWLCETCHVAHHTKLNRQRKQSA